MEETDPFFIRYSLYILHYLKEFVIEHQTALLTLSAVAVWYKTRITFKARETRRKWDSAGKDIVVLHAGGPSKTNINSSPFVVKLDMYLTMAGIPFKHDSRKPYGPKGKMPWITLNGEDIADSQMIIDHLNKKFGKDFNAGLTSEQKAVARSMRLMMEEHLLWGVAWWRFVGDQDCNFMKYNKVPWFGWPIIKFGLVRHKVESVMWAQGTGRHSKQEIIAMMNEDLEALSHYLGEKKFLMGDEPSEIDCTAFGFLSEFLWELQGNPWLKTITEKYSNLPAYCERLRDRFYPNWEQRLWKEK